MSGLADERHSLILNYFPNYTVRNTATPEDGGFLIYGNFMIHDGPDLISNTMWGAAGCVEVMGEMGFNRLKQFIYDLSGSNNTDIEKALVELVAEKKLYIIIEKAKRPSLIPIE